MKLTQILNEIGEASSKPFKWRRGSSLSPKDMVELPVPPDKETYYDYFYTFDANGVPYRIQFNGRVERKLALQLPGMKPLTDRDKYEVRINVDFNTESGYDTKTTPDTNKGDQFRVLATVVDTIVDFVKDFNKDGPSGIVVDEFYIAPKADDEDVSKMDSRRARFYQAYIKRQLNKINMYGIRYRASTKSYKGSEYIQLDTSTPVN